MNNPQELDLEKAAHANNTASSVVEDTLHNIVLMRLRQLVLLNAGMIKEIERLRQARESDAADSGMYTQSLETGLDNANDTIAELESQLSDATEKAARFERERDELVLAIDDLRDQLEHKDTELSALAKQLAEQSE